MVGVPAEPAASSSGRSPAEDLLKAASDGNVELLRKLLAAKVPVDTKDEVSYITLRNPRDDLWRKIKFVVRD